jgi:2,3-diketo-5-methylthio-1-phosphopentane phosphatase
MRVYCDFDGTITTVDTTDLVLERLAPARWRDIEAEWVAGRIGSAECMGRQVELLAADDAAIDAVLDEVPLADGFVEFARWCASRRVPLVVVSDGVDYFIRRILVRHGLWYLPVIANRLQRHAGTCRLEHPYLRTGCSARSGVCKCAVARTDPGYRTVYIGDGRSDFCPSGRADVLFARDALARHARDQGIPFLPYRDFNDVLAMIARLPGVPRGAAARRQTTATKEH